MSSWRQILVEHASPIFDPEMGKRIREIRKKNDILQAEFASAVGLSQATVSRIESGLISPSVPVSVLLKALRSTPEELFGIPRKGAA